MEIVSGVLFHTARAQCLKNPGSYIMCGRCGFRFTPCDGGFQNEEGVDLTEFVDSRALFDPYWSVYKDGIAPDHDGWYMAGGIVIALKRDGNRWKDWNGAIVYHSDGTPCKNNPPIDYKIADAPHWRSALVHSLRMLDMHYIWWDGQWMMGRTAPMWDFEDGYGGSGIWLPPKYQAPEPDNIRYSLWKV